MLKSADFMNISGTTIVFLIEMIGTVAFASSGAMVGIRKNMDIFGVNMLGITTAVGGGIIRDLVLGATPPRTFKDPVYILVSMVTSCLLFICVYFNKQFLESKWMAQYERLMMTLDAIGLGAFTVMGIYVAIHRPDKKSALLLIFVGMVTGIGGGMLRDVMAGMTPFVFVKHVYACASMVGAIVCVALLQWIDEVPAMIIGAAVIIVIRLLAARFRWNLPRIR
ncbi:MAG: trimeric intracellular cation channel family protein [Clostridiales bacterium]|nr:trimeric intracellular cation channel family protein [Clostridiales bacterium]MDY3746361.1 trimeric intracellular cation channel family protein [Lachnospiraceae bacterium]